MTLDLKSYRRDCLLGALGALLMLVGDLCLQALSPHSTETADCSRGNIT